MSISTDRGNPFLTAYSLVRRSGILQTSIGRRLFKSAYFLYKRYIEDDLQALVQALPALIDFFVERDFKIYLVHPRGKLSQGMLSLEHFSYCCRALKGSLNQALASSGESIGSSWEMA